METRNIVRRVYENSFSVSRSYTKTRPDRKRLILNPDTY